MASNGNIPTRQMRQVDGWAWLAPGAAAAWLLFAFYVQMQTGIRPIITRPDGAYRNLARQIYWKAYWTVRGKPGNAAPVGRSNHGLGMAIDIANYLRYNHAWLVAAAARFGFRFDVSSENWHIHFTGAPAYYSTAPAGGGTSPLTITGENMRLALDPTRSTSKKNQYVLISGVGVRDYTGTQAQANTLATQLGSGRTIVLPAADWAPFMAALK